jgi:hypothetical protein
MLSAALRIVLVASVAAVNLLAQASFTGTILGTVTDPAGAVVAGAAVSVSNLATNELHRVQTDGSGNYFVPNLKPGAYSVSVESVEASGFKRFIQDRVRYKSINVRAWMPGWCWAPHPKSWKSPEPRPSCRPRAARSARWWTTTRSSACR